MLVTSTCAEFSAPILRLVAVALPLIAANAASARSPAVRQPLALSVPKQAAIYRPVSIELSVPAKARGVVQSDDTHDAYDADRDGGQCRASSFGSLRQAGRTQTRRCGTKPPARIASPTVAGRAASSHGSELDKERLLLI